MTISSLRTATRNYLTALTISAGIVTGTKTGWRVDSRAEIVRVERRPLVDDRWDPGEIVPGVRPALVVVEEQRVARPSGLIAAN